MIQILKEGIEKHSNINIKLNKDEKIHKRGVG